MKKYHLAVDIGASSGRHILGHLKDGKIVPEEIYRFENQMAIKDGKKLWDTQQIFTEILNGMKKCKEMNKIPQSMSIDTWAVDYVLLDKNDKVLGDTFAYRDNRTAKMDKEIYKIISEEKLYQRTGIQKQIFNTVYQLMAWKKNTPEQVEKAKAFLMLPDYFQFLLTGNKKSEYTNAASTQLVSPDTKQWDAELLNILGYPREIFLPLTMAGEYVGCLTQNIQKEVGFNLDVVQCASHDTASAVLAVPETEKNMLYISSGTWSLMGTEIFEANCAEDSRKDNFTNEGGYDYRFRYLKNIMGLWMVQSVRHELKDEYSFAQLCGMAEECKNFSSRVNVNDDVFLAPDSMIEAVKGYCKNTCQPIPNSVGEVCAVIYQSLAECYGETAREIEDNIGCTYDCINIIGGGSNADYLNRLTAEVTGKTVYAGPAEATAIGNLLTQMIAGGELDGFLQARQCVKKSFEIKKYYARKEEDV